MGDGHGVLLVVDVVAQDDELVAAEPGHGVGGAHDLARSGGPRR